MENKIDANEKRFLQISMDPSDNSMLRKSDVRFINIDEIQQAVILGPITHNLAGIDLNQPECIIDEKQYSRYESLLNDRMFVFDLHILLKNGEIISRTYIDTLMDELLAISQCLSANSIIIDDPSMVRLAKADLKFCTRSAEFEESEKESSIRSTVKYKEIKIKASFELGDGKYELISKTIDLITIPSPKKVE